MMTSSHAYHQLVDSSVLPITTRVLVSGRDEILEVDPLDVLQAALVPGALQPSNYQAEKKRWYILFVFSYLSAIQSMIWCTYSTVPEYSNSYFMEATDSQHLLDLLLNWGCIIYLPAVFFSSWLLTNNQGLRICVVLGASLCFLSALLRMLITFFPLQTRDQYLTQFILMTHVAQILNAIVGPLVMASPSKLSLQWFPDAERATATAIASVSGGVGVGCAYLLGPAIVHQTEDINTLLRVITIMASVPLAFALIFFPDQPKLYPSASAAETAKKNADPADQLSFTKGIAIAAKSFPFLCLMLSGALQSGIFIAWYSTLPTQLIPLNYSQAQSGSFTSITRFSCILGGIMTGRLSYSFQRKFKMFLLLFLLLAIVPFALFTLSVPSLAVAHPVLPSNFWFLFSCVAGAGFFLGAATPLYYELGAELVYPAPESTAAGLMTLLANVGALIMFSLSPTIDLSKVNPLMTISVSVSLVLVLLVREVYYRSEAGEGYRVKNEGVAAVLQYYAQVTGVDRIHSNSTANNLSRANNNQSHNNTVVVSNNVNQSSGREEKFHYND